MGTVVGAIASGRVPVGNAEGDPVTSWLNAVSLLIGALFVATCAYLAAVFLVSDARRRGPPTSSATSRPARWERPWLAGALAVAGILVLNADAEYVYDRLTQEGPAARDRLRALRPGRAGAAPPRRGPRGPAARGRAPSWRSSGAGASRSSRTCCPEKLEIADAAAPDATLTGVLIVFGVAVVLVLPAIALLFTLAQRSVIEETEAPRATPPGGEIAPWDEAPRIPPAYPPAASSGRLDRRLDRPPEVVRALAGGAQRQRGEQPCRAPCPSRTL